MPSVLEEAAGEGPAKCEQRQGGTSVYKIVVLGEGGVGKSALTLQFVRHCFLDYHDPTIEDAYQQQAVIDDEPALLDILDTAGQMEFTAMREQYMRCGEGFIICYATCDRRSFDEVPRYADLIGALRASSVCPVVLVGTKLDLAHQRTVSTEEGLTLAQSYGWPFFETSAALRQGVEEVFHTAVRAIRCGRKNLPLPPCGILPHTADGGLRAALKMTRSKSTANRWKNFKLALLNFFRRNRK
ncbi:hypothetical protein HAZT_HAZT009439 [Hyalella azteca]|uniref:small monomeric GTPase n=1 Tax=Hyalella azteca TaxID=294128 RepID=A0A6A0GW86_HYAAZ|nr:GTP-binding protein Rit2 [Hyalella azteca]KAA0190249.1 hypothetical protein HAZT_HAZT009439 [Hyalella azteca]